MIDGKDSVKRAREYFDSVYQDAKLQEVLLEESELSEDGKHWLITFGFDWQPSSGTSSIGPGERRYKLITLDAESGAVLSMKNARFGS